MKQLRFIATETIMIYQTYSFTTTSSTFMIAIIVTESLTSIKTIMATIILRYAFQTVFD